MDGGFEGFFGSAFLGLPKCRISERKMAAYPARSALLSQYPRPFGHCGGPDGRPLMPSHTLEESSQRRMRMTSGRDASSALGH